MTRSGLIDKESKEGVQRAWELTLFHKVRSWDDGLSMFCFESDFSWFKGDHQPSFGLHLIIFNWTIFEFRIYNTLHC